MGAEPSKPDDGLDSDHPRNTARSGILAGTRAASIYNQGHATVSAKKCHSRSRSKSRERGEEVAPCLYASAQMFVDLMGGRYDWGTDLVNQNEEPAAIFCSQDIEILHVNQKFASIFGYAPARIIGKRIADFNGKDAEDVELRAIEVAIQARQNQTFSKVLMYSTGKSKDARALLNLSVVISHPSGAIQGIPPKMALVKATFLGDIGAGYLAWKHAKDNFKDWSPKIDLNRSLLQRTNNEDLLQMIKNRKQQSYEAQRSKIGTTVPVVPGLGKPNPPKFVRPEPPKPDPSPYDHVKHYLYGGSDGILRRCVVLQERLVGLETQTLVDFPKDNIVALDYQGKKIYRATLVDVGERLWVDKTKLRPFYKKLVGRPTETADLEEKLFRQRDAAKRK